MRSSYAALLRAWPWPPVVWLTASFAVLVIKNGILERRVFMDLLTGIVMSGIMAGGSYAASKYSSDKAAKTGFAMNKTSWEYYKKQRELDYEYDKGVYFDLDKKYNEWYKQLEYDWSKRYAENSAKWNVEGLKNAGLNPLLAASNGNFASTYGNSSPVTATRSSSGSALGKSADMHGNRDVGSTLANVGSTVMKAVLADSEMTQAEASANVAEKTQEANINSAKAGAEKMAAEVSAVKAQEQASKADALEKMERAKKTAVETFHLQRRGGYEGDWGNLNNLGHEGLDWLKRGKSALDDFAKGLSDSLKSTAKDGVDWVRRKNEEFERSKPIRNPSVELDFRKNNQGSHLFGR